MEKIHTRQPISIKHMLGKNSDRNSIQWNTTQQWKWKISMYNNMDIPHKKYWMKSQSHEKMMFVVSMVIIFGKRVGIGLDESTRGLLKCWINFSFLDLDAVHMDVYLVVNHGTDTCDLYTLLYACYTSIIMFIYKNGLGSTYINLERYYIINESFH